MRPALPPGLVALLCPVPRSRQGVPERTLARLVARPWGKWKVETAEKWCAVCGFDFWRLDAANNMDKFAKVDWVHKTKRVRQALSDILRGTGVRNPTIRQQDALAAALAKVG